MDSKEANIYDIREKDMNSRQQESSLKRALSQIVPCIIKDLLILAFGMTLSFSTILIPAFASHKEAFDFTTEGLTWIGSINYICFPVGSIIASGVTEYLGRKRSMQLINIPFIAAWLLFAFSSSEWHVLVAVGLTGLSGGFLQAPVIAYIAEISEPTLRGTLSSTAMISINAGIPVMFILGTFFHWRTIAIISLFINVLSIICLCFVPESPHWLVGKDRFGEARQSLAWLRGWTTEEVIEDEYKKIYFEVKHHNECPEDDQHLESESTVQIEMVQNASEIHTKGEILGRITQYFSKRFLWPLSLVTTVFFFYHTTGMTTLQTYAIPILESLEVSIDKYYALIILGTAEFLGTFGTISLVHFIGKRRLNFTTLLLNGAFCVVVGIYAHLGNITNLSINIENSNVTLISNAQITNNFNWIPLTFCTLIAFVSNAGIRILPWILTRELYPNNMRSVGAGFSAAFAYVIGFLINKGYLYIINLLTLAGTFWAHGVMSLIGFTVLYFFLPETEGKSLGQITEHFNGGAKLSNSVYRGEECEKRKLKMRQRSLPLTDMGPDSSIVLLDLAQASRRRSLIG